jgi:hypothetical protein
MAIYAMLRSSHSKTTRNPRRPRGYVSRAEFGAKWPLTVDDGVLACTNNAVTFTQGGAVYAVNGRAKGRTGYLPIEPIWQTQALDLKFTKLERVPEPVRRRLFAASVACEDIASTAVEDGKPQDVKALKAKLAHQQRLSDQCKSALRRNEKLTEGELEQVGNEGVALTWPPLSPTRVNIGPLIERGLALCRQ